MNSAIAASLRMAFASRLDSYSASSVLMYVMRQAVVCKIRVADDEGAGGAMSVRANENEGHTPHITLKKARPQAYLCFKLFAQAADEV